MTGVAGVGGLCATEDAGAEEEKETDMFRVRKRGDTADAASGKRTDVDESAVIASRLEDYFGKDEDLDENERFLKDYLHSEGWRDKDSVRARSPPHRATLSTAEAGNEVWAWGRLAGSGSELWGGGGRHGGGRGRRGGAGAV